MQNIFIELSTEKELLPLFEIYKDCMYLPTKEKYKVKVQHWLQDRSISIFSSVSDGEIKGLLILQLQSETNAEIIGLSVEEGCRKQGHGTFLIEKIQEHFPKLKLAAETDGDAVGFYRKTGFKITEIQKNYGGEMVIRYLCAKK